MEHVRVSDLRLTVVTGPVFNVTEPRQGGCVGTVCLPRGVKVLDQSAELGDVDLEEALRRAEENQAMPPPGKFRTFQVPILDLEEFTVLDFGPATLADRLVQRAQSRRVELGQLSDIAVYCSRSTR